MTAHDTATASGSWRPWLKTEAANWLFVLRTVLAILLALLVAFRLDLSSPASAAVTVSIIALPQAGMVLEKSFYRLVGTLLGAVVTLVLIATLIQHRDSFIVAVAIWIGLCTAASSRFRGFQAYGWLLCGYTTCLIGFPAFMDANHAFDIAVDRVTIVCVGIMSAGVVNATVLPLRSTDTLIRLVRRCYIDFVYFAELATHAGNARGMSTAHHQFSRDLAQLEAARSSSLFEDPTTRVKGRRLLGFLGALMVAGSRLHLLHRQLDHLESHDPATLRAMSPQLFAFRQALRMGDQVPANAAEASCVARQLAALLVNPSDPKSAEGPGPDGGRGRSWRSTLLLLNEAVEEAQVLGSSYADMSPLRGVGVQPAAPRLRIGSDALQATLSGLRATLVVLVSSAFWIASAWPAGFSMTLIGVVSCALFSSAANPTAAALNMCKGFLLAIPALTVCFSLLLPAAGDFYTLALVLTPFLAFGAWLMTRPEKSLIGGGFLLNFLTALNLATVMQYDSVAVFNNTLAYTLGIVLAAISLAVMPGSRSWRSMRARKVLLRSVRSAGTDRLSGLRARFESQVRDLTLSLIDVRAPDSPSDDDELLGLLVLEIGDAIIRLRLNESAAGESAAQVCPVLESIIEAVERQDAAGLLALDLPLAQLLTETTADEPGKDSDLQRFVGLNSLRVALAELGAFLSPTATRSARHAA